MTGLVTGIYCSSGTLQLQIDHYYLAVVYAGMEFCTRLAQGICRVTDVQQFDAGSGTAH